LSLGTKHKRRKMFLVLVGLGCGEPIQERCAWRFLSNLFPPVAQFDEISSSIWFKERLEHDVSRASGTRRSAVSGKDRPIFGEGSAPWVRLGSVRVSYFDSSLGCITKDWQVWGLTADATLGWVKYRPYSAREAEVDVSAKGRRWGPPYTCLWCLHIDLYTPNWGLNS